MELTNKCIMLTGASGGIGQAIAMLLSAKGVKLILVSRNKERFQQLKASLTRPEQHICLSADMTTEQGMEQISQLVHQYKQSGGVIDALINGAGSNEFQYFAQRSVSSLEQELRLNLLSPILLSQSALGWLQRPGIILNIGSAFGSIGYPGYASYCAAKAGIHRFSEALDRELDGANIRVLYLAPRATQTEMNNATVRSLNQQLGNKSDTPETVAQCVVDMLQKETASKWIGWPEKLFAKVNQLFPKLVSASIRKQQSVIQHFLNQES